MAEDAALELPELPFEDALQLVQPYAERGSRKFEKAALRWLERYLTAGSPRLQHFAEFAAWLYRLRLWVPNAWCAVSFVGTWPFREAFSGKTR